MSQTWVRFMVGISCPHFQVEQISFQYIHYLAIVIDYRFLWEFKATRLRHSIFRPFLNIAKSHY